MSSNCRSFERPDRSQTKVVNLRQDSSSKFRGECKCIELAVGRSVDVEGVQDRSECDPDGGVAEVLPFVHAR